MKIRYVCCARTFCRQIGYAHQPGNRRTDPCLATLLNDIPPARLFEESLKCYKRATVTKPISCCVNIICSAAVPDHYPLLHGKWRQPDGGIIEQVLKNTDTRIHNDMRVTRRSCLPPCSGTHCWRRHRSRPGKRPDLSRRFRAGDERRVDEACRSLAIPKRLTTLTRDSGSCSCVCPVVRVNAHGNC